MSGRAVASIACATAFIVPVKELHPLGSYLAASLDDGRGFLLDARGAALLLGGLGAAPSVMAGTPDAAALCTVTAAGKLVRLALPQGQ